MRSGFVARRGLSVSVYYSIAVYELSSSIVSAQKLSLHRLFRAEDKSLAENSSSGERRKQLPTVKPR